MNTERNNVLAWIAQKVFGLLLIAAMADILEQARDFVQSDYDSGKIFSDEDTRNGYTDTIYFLEIAREKLLEMAEKWAGKDK